MMDQDVLVNGDCPGAMMDDGSAVKMRAWVLHSDDLHGPASFREEEIPVPQLGANDVLVANRAAGVNFNAVWASRGQPVDVVSTSSRFDADSSGFHICGSEASGVVVAVGDDVRSPRPGDEVMITAGQYDPLAPDIMSGTPPELSSTYRIWGYESSWGAFAEYSKVKDYQCVLKPSFLTWEQAATCLATGVPVHRMLTHWSGNAIKRSDVVLVWGGAGGIGATAIQQAVASGATVVAVVSSQDRAEYCWSLGATGCMDRTRFDHWGDISHLDQHGYRQWMVSATRFRNQFFRILGQRRLPDLVIEHPGADTIPTSMFMCAPGGMVVLCGATSGYRASVDLRLIWMFQKRLQGSHSGDSDDVERYVRFLRAHSLVPPLTRTYEWDQLPQAHADLEVGVILGKAAIRIGGESIREGWAST